VYGPPVTFAGPNPGNDGASTTDAEGSKNEGEESGRSPTMIRKKLTLEEPMSVPQEMYDALKQKLYGQEGEIK
jgi:hypothetical protein